MPTNAMPHAGASRITRFGNVAVCELRLGHEAIRPSAANAETGRERLRLVFALDGEVHLGQRGASIRLCTLHWRLCGAGPLVLSSPAAAEALILSVRGTARADSREIVRPTADGIGNVLLACIRSAVQAAPCLTSHARAELGCSLDDLAHLAIREGVAPGRRLSGRSVMRERVKAYVRNNLHNSDLSIEAIAQAFNCTKRYLHKVFSEDERSLNQYIWDMRLERCSRDLANAGLRQRSITEIALVWGFRSSPHFSRAFRQRFGASPSAYRSLQELQHVGGADPRVVGAQAH